MLCPILITILGIITQSLAGINNCNFIRGIPPFGRGWGFVKPIGTCDSFNSGSSHLLDSSTMFSCADNGALIYTEYKGTSTCDPNANKTEYINTSPYSEFPAPINTKLGIYGVSYRCGNISCPTMAIKRYSSVNTTEYPCNVSDSDIYGYDYTVTHYITDYIDYGTLHRCSCDGTGGALTINTAYWIEVSERRNVPPDYVSYEAKFNETLTCDPNDGDRSYVLSCDIDPNDKCGIISNNPTESPAIFTIAPSIATMKPTMEPTMITIQPTMEPSITIIEPPIQSSKNNKLIISLSFKIFVIFAAVLM